MANFIKGKKKKSYGGGMTPRRRHYKPINSKSAIDTYADEAYPPSLFGVSALGFPDKSSPVRVNMNTHQASQRVVLCNPEPAMVSTGPETAFGKESSWYMEAEHDYEIINSFRKFKNAPVSPICYVFKDLTTGKYTCAIFNEAINLKEKNGFRMQNFIANKHPGDILPEGTPIMGTTSYQNGNYCAGVNLRTVYTIIPDITEDALIISDYAAERMAYNVVDTIEVEVDPESFLLNRYGNDEIYKAFPDIGEYVQDGIVCAMRENSFVSSLKEASIPHINDKKYYSKGMVVDIDIKANTQVENEQCAGYLAEIYQWYSDIFACVSSIVDGHPEQNDCSLLDMYSAAQKYLHDSVWVTKEGKVNIQITFTIVHKKIPRKGQKVTGRVGNKSVVADVRKRELMPKTCKLDEHGNPIPGTEEPVDVISNGLAIPNRIIPFVLYEVSMTNKMKKFHNYLLSLHDKGESRDKIVSEAINFVDIFTPKDADKMRELYRYNPELVYDDIIKNGLFLTISPLNEVITRDALLEAEDKYPNILTRDYIMTKLLHRWVVSEEPHVIGYQYYWVLKQEADKKLSSISTGRTTKYDQPVKTKQFSKHLREYSDNPVRFGEYDSYNMLAAIGVKDYVKMATWYRGSQYEENSILMSHINNKPVDASKYNKFPQIDNLKNVLKYIGVKLEPDIYGYNTIGERDVIETVNINNVPVDISIPDLRIVLIIYSFYINYCEYMNSVIRLDDFYEKMKEQKNVFEGLDEMQIREKFELFVHMIPILQQIKQY